jgi:hypothetical protein
MLSLAQQIAIGDPQEIRNIGAVLQVSGLLCNALFLHDALR